MTKGEIQAVIFVVVSLLAGAVILLVNRYDSDFLPDLEPASAHGRLNAGIETESATTDVDDSIARLPSTRANSGHPAARANSGRPDARANSGRPAAGTVPGLPAGTRNMEQPAAGTSSNSASATGNLLVPVNTAPASELQKLPGIGPKLAEAIIEHRTRSGDFVRVEQLLEVKGIGPAKLGRIRPLVKLK